MVIQQFFSSTLLGVECYAVQSGLLGKKLITTRYSQLRSAIKLLRARAIADRSGWAL